MDIDYYDQDVKEKGEGFVIIKRKIIIPKGKTTLKGQYPKLEKDENCLYPERASCNSGLFWKRCPYMKCLGLGDWRCTFKKDEKKTPKINKIH